MQEALLRQKARLSWFKDGDCNSKYFHSVIRDSRKKLHIHRIKNHNDRWIQGKTKLPKLLLGITGNFLIWSSLTNCGNCNIWWDNWCEKGPLAKLYPDCTYNVVHSVKEYISNVLPDNIVHHIGNISIGDENHSDYVIWNLTQDGLYSNISAWQSIREVRQKNLFLGNV
ncbi:hypothetical protein H5410_026008 [Solanum commersonii]|uniref:Uncharacterized protein n=1 Tax=Solanum commersonii TaxID=4109 RepID=A0A9J5YZK4_SOLCO|nr:hypothetical protein H5410_026008 [Solanum commersonii]